MKKALKCLMISLIIISMKAVLALAGCKPAATEETTIEETTPTETAETTTKEAPAEEGVVDFQALYDEVSQLQGEEASPQRGPYLKAYLWACSNNLI